MPVERTTPQLVKKGKGKKRPGYRGPGGYQGGGGGSKGGSKGLVRRFLVAVVNCNVFISLLQTSIHTLPMYDFFR